MEFRLRRVITCVCWVAYAGSWYICAATAGAPHLQGQHLRITALTQENYVDYNPSTGTYSGYLIRIMERLSIKANFTYDLLSPSGQRDACNHPDDGNVSLEPYDPFYFGQYKCGEFDVSGPATEYSSDMYLGTFYITPDRLKRNDFTVSFHPPLTGSVSLVGTATEVDNFAHYVEKQQTETSLGPICVVANTAYYDYLATNFPEAEFVPVVNAEGAFLENLKAGKCQAMAMDYTAALRFVNIQHRQNECKVNGKPVGLIDVLSFGLDKFAIGVRQDLPSEVLTTLNFWLMTLMHCPPIDTEGGSPLCNGTKDSMSAMYDEYIGNSDGAECGYVRYPPPENGRRLSRMQLTAVIVSGFVVLVAATMIANWWQTVQRKKRYKLRFVQQISRNIAIGRSPGSIPADQIAAQISHIADSRHGNITKEALSKWIYDVKLNFLSESDFDALWAAIDIDNNGEVNMIEFVTFLSCCGNEFEQVYRDIEKMPKMERLKLAARRLENINKLGEEGVRKLENQLDRRGRHAVHPPRSQQDFSDSNSEE